MALILVFVLSFLVSMFAPLPLLMVIGFLLWIPPTIDEWKNRKVR